jgi:hypothetical protein
MSVASPSPFEMQERSYDFPYHYIPQLSNLTEPSFPTPSVGIRRYARAAYA